MPLASMTGFARSQGSAGSYHWAWELKSVNGKGLDLRLRLPQGWDAIEVPARTSATRHLARGNVSATLDIERNGALPAVQSVVKTGPQVGELEDRIAILGLRR